jgi:epoxyqueuosine reductase
MSAAQNQRRVIPGASLSEDPDPLVRAHAAWALGQIRTPEAARALRQTGVRERDPTVLEEIQAAMAALSQD